ncbi:hypothetical protein FHS44_000121 [Streptosporangium saharense]|uniref:Uncharacterized protein n=1 Tax=Streptosporangium saharense TaxID=1706840 RepID=A0A7W7VK76_9ACTN|nr:hypothetical protein [Streptosporangium saharense]
MLRDTAGFFRRGTSESGRELLTSDELAHYHERTSRLPYPTCWNGSTAAEPYGHGRGWFSPHDRQTVSREVFQKPNYTIWNGFRGNRTM